MSLSVPFWGLRINCDHCSLYYRVSHLLLWTKKNGEASMQNFRASGPTKCISFMIIYIRIGELIIKTHLSNLIRLLWQLSIANCYITFFGTPCTNCTSGHSRMTGIALLIFVTLMWKLACNSTKQFWEQRSTLIGHIFFMTQWTKARKRW